MSNAKSAYATLFQLETASVYNTVEEITSISGPTQKANAIDVTNMDSPSAFKEYIAGIIDGGQVAIEGNWTGGTQQSNLFNNFQARTLSSFKILLPGTQPAAGSFAFAGIVIDHSLDFKVADRITWKATVQVTGKPTYATA